MNTKLVMVSSAAILGLAGILLSFFPSEIAPYLDLSVNQPIVLQILGALYFGFAILNWTAKANLIGGIYSKPVAIGNFAHFMMGALALAELAFNTTGLTHVWIAAIIYSIFTLIFGYIFFMNPLGKKNTSINKQAVNAWAK